MKKSAGILALIVILGGGMVSGCSGAFWGGTAGGTVATGAGYEIHARQRLNQIEADYKAGRIDQREYEIRKNEVGRNSITN